MNVREKYSTTDWESGAKKVECFKSKLLKHLPNLTIDDFDESACRTDLIVNKSFEDSAPDLLITTSSGCKILIEVTGPLKPINYTANLWLRRKKLDKMYELYTKECIQQSAFLFMSKYIKKDREIVYLYRCFWFSDYFQHYKDGQLRLEGIQIETQNLRGISTEIYSFPYDHTAIIQKLSTITCRVGECHNRDAGIICPNDCKDCPPNNTI